MHNGSVSSSGESVGLWRRVSALGVLLALVLSVVVLPSWGAANAETREEAVAKRDESQSKVDELKGEVEGIDAELKALFVEMEQTKLDLATAQVELADAEAELAAAERHLENVRLELEAAQAELDELISDVNTSKVKENDLTQAVGGMARNLYRGDSDSTLEVVMSSSSTAEISNRAAAAASLGRVQSKALDQVRSGLVVQENQKERQSAVTERISALEAEAEVAAVAAEEAKDAVAEKLSGLEALQASQKSAEANWNARKGEAEKQLAAHNAAAASAVARIQDIDRQNQEQQFVVGSAASPAAGALFANPFRFDAPVTSPFGYRIHPIFGTRSFHTGVDFGAGCGTAQYATRAGVVVEATFDSGLGYYVTINHGLINGQSMVTEHGHLQSIAVSVGQSVDTGTVVGYTGTTGNSTGCHLHLNLLINGSYNNALDYM